VEGDASFEAQELGGDLALVVVHGDYGVEVTATGGDEESVGRVRAGYVDPVSLRAFDGWADEFYLFSAEETTFSGVRV
jgi:hypothetical protein